MCDGRAALGTEDAMVGLARGAVLREALLRAANGELGFGDNGDEGCRISTLYDQRGEWKIQ